MNTQAPLFDSSNVPSIRLVTATPSAAGNWTEPNSLIDHDADLSRVAPWTVQPPAPLPTAASSLRGAKPRIAPLADGSTNKKRLVPKKSKLGLLSQKLPSFNSLNGGKENSLLAVPNNKKSVNGASVKSADVSFQDDSTLDPELGEIVMIKKKKSRVALGNIAWDGNAPLGEVSTNVPKGVKEVSKKEKEEKKEDKWWSTIAVGRGRKDSKDKEKDRFPERAKTPEPVLERNRFNSLDSSILLQSTAADDQPKRAIRGRVSSAQLLNVVPAQIVSRSASDAPQASNQFLAPPSAYVDVPAASTSTSASQSEHNSGSVASRAMRSVRSLARIASWNQLKDYVSDDVDKEKVTKPKKESKKDTLKKEKKTKEKKSKEKEKDRATVRLSTSSFEAGALSHSPQPSPVVPQSQTLGTKRSRIFTLGLGLPSSMRVRSGSTASSILLSPSTSYQPMATLGASFPNNPLGRDRSGSGASSLRPASTVTNSSGGSRLSTASCAPSAISRVSSGASVRWDEDALQTVKERRRQERKERKEQDAKEGKTRRDSKESRNPKRTSLADIFPETVSAPSRPVSTTSTEVAHEGLPILTFETATCDGHSVYSRSSASTTTPVKKQRPRPWSDQMLPKDMSRPTGIREDGEVLSMLDAATNELALLINNLDLEATPATPDMTPLKPSDSSPAGRRSHEQESPLQKKSKSLRPMNSLRTTVREASNSTQLLGQHIAPWKDLNRQLSPIKSPPKRSTPKAKFRLTHKRTLTPSPAPEPLPVFQPLQPPSRRVTPMSRDNRESAISDNSCHVPSMITFGSRSSTDFHAESEDDDVTNNNATVRKRRVRSSTESSTGLPRMGRETRRRLGLSGTMGGSAGSDYVPEELDPSDPDSDIPDELQMILGGRPSAEMEREDTISFKGPLGAPPQVPLPDISVEESDNEDTTGLLPAAVISEADAHQEDDYSFRSEEDMEDTKKSFDFTGEIKKLSESCANRASFIEQLENAFRTPARVDLRCDFDFFLPKDAPPVPKLPFEFAKNISKTTLGEELNVASGSPSALPGSDSLTYSGDEDVEMTNGELSVPLRNKSSAESTGELNRNFRFGGKTPSTSSLAPSTSSQSEESDKRSSILTLSDIIPPPEHARSISLGEDVTHSSVYKSIFAAVSKDMPTAMMMPSPHRHAISETGMRQFTRADIARRSVYDEAPSNRSSIASFSGLGDSFDEVRRGFEFHDNRPGFYANASKSWSHNKHDSVFSLASVSSYGHVVNPGIPDPFEYGTSAMGLSSLKEQPSCEDMSMSMTVDDTFSFIKHGNVIRPRQRVESDASSFYFQAPASRRCSVIQSRRESTISISSLAPPISLYNRSYGNPRFSHRRDESSSSFTSLAHNYAVYGATGGRDVWARHQREASVDSVMSDFSAMRLGRPGIGDKMFENGPNGPSPLSAIAGSPGGSIDETYDNDRRERDSMFDPRMSMFDSIMDGSEEQAQRQFMHDSLFERTGCRSSIMSSAESLFGRVDPMAKLQYPRPQLRYRPISVASIVSVHDAVKEEDTMITMIGGGHVRRMSVSSAVDASPCARAGKRKYTPNTDPVEQYLEQLESPKKARLIEVKPSIESTSSLMFGDERMERATKGLLERQSLEETCFVGSGEDSSVSMHSVPVFSRPRPGARSRSSTCTSASSGRDTPPLSCSDTSSIGSQSSIDVSVLDMMLSNTTQSAAATSRTRAKPRGRGHKRFSVTRMSRSSVYETINEEDAESLLADKQHSPTARRAVYITDPDSISLSGSIVDETAWDNERGIEALRKFYALKDEAQDTVQESKRTWADTAFSTYAVQSFALPSHLTGMKAMLEHSQKNYGPLPSELRPHRVRSRTSSRASPYFVPTPVRSLSAIRKSPSPPPPAPVLEPTPEPVKQAVPLPLQEVKLNTNLPQFLFSEGKPSEQDEKSSKPDLNKWGLPRPRVPSGARRVALGWTKRSAGTKTSTKSKTSTGLKENAPPKTSIGLKENAPPKTSTGLKENSGLGLTPGQTLRVNRPRPKGRPSTGTVRARPLAIYN